MEAVSKKVGVGACLRCCEIKLQLRRLLLAADSTGFCILQAGEIAAVKEDAERDLAEAKPALDAALAALNSITPKDIGALKALKNPPDIIKRIFDCVLLLRWAAAAAVAAYAHMRRTWDPEFDGIICLVNSPPVCVQAPTGEQGNLAGRQGRHGAGGGVRGGREDDGRHELPAGLLLLRDAAIF